MRYDPSQSVKTGYLGNCLFQFAWETWGIFSCQSWGCYLPATPWFLRVCGRLVWEWSLVLLLCLVLSPPGQEFLCSFTRPGWPDLYLQLPHVHKQLIFLSVSLIYFAFYFLVHIYCWHSLKMLATWASSLACSGLHRQVPMAALFQPGKLKSKLSCAQLTCGVIPLSPNLNCYLIHLNLSCSF